MARHFEFSDGKSHKFWEISIDDRTLAVRFGRVGTSGQTMTKELDSAEAARLAADKQVAEKVRNGYVESVATPPTAVPVKAKATGTGRSTGKRTQPPSEPPATPPAKTPVASAADPAKEIGKAHQLLGKNDLDAVRNGIAILEHLEARAAWSALAEGVSVDDIGQVVVARGSVIHQRVKAVFREEVALRALFGAGRSAEVKTIDLKERHYPDLKALRGFAALERLEARYLQTLTSLDGIAGLTALESVDFSSCVTLRSLEGLQGLANLKEARLYACEALTDITALGGLRGIKKLDLHACESLTNLDAIGTLSGLEELNLSGVPALTSLAPIGQLRKLKSLDLSGAGLTDLSGIEQLPALEALHLHGDLRTLRPLAPLSKLKVLRIALSDGMGDIEGLEALTGLQELDLSESSALTNLRALNGLVALRSLNLTNCTALVDLDGVQGLHVLKELQLTGCAALPVESLARLQGAKALKTLDLDDVEAVPLNYRHLLQGKKIAAFVESLCREIQQVQQLAAEGVPIKHAMETVRRSPSAPAILRPEVAKALFTHAVRSSPPAGPPAVASAKGVTPKSPSQILSLIGRNDAASVHQGIALALALDDAEFWLELATLLSVNDEGSIQVPKDCAVRKRVKVDFREEVALWALSKTGRLKKVRQLYLESESLTSLEPLRGLTKLKTLRVDSAVLTDIDALNSLTALEELTIPSGGSLTGLGDGGLHGLVSLKYLELGGFDALEGLEGIRALPRLERLCIFRSGIRSLEGMGALPQLQSLYVDQCGSLTTLKGIAMLPRLEELRITACSALADAKGMEGSPRLRDVRVTGDVLKSLDGVRNLPSLEELYVRSEALVHLGDLEGLPVLGDVWLYACTALHRYDSLRALPKLTRLHLNESTHLKSLKAFRELAGLKLESLDLLWCRALSSLDGIESLTTLKELDLRGCERVTKFEPIANLRALKTVDLTESGASWDYRRALSGPVLTAFLMDLCTK